MKKIISLVMVLSLVLCLATAALADEPAVGSLENPIVVTDIADLASIDVPMGEVKWYLLPAEWSGMILTFTTPWSMNCIYTYSPMFGENIANMSYESTTYALEGDSDFLIGLAGFRGNEVVGGSCTVAAPVLGSEAMPDELTDVSAPVTINCVEGAYGYEYFMTWTNNGEGGYLTLNGVTGNFDVVELNWSGYYSDSTDPVSIGVVAGDTVTITVRGVDQENITLDLSFEPFEEGKSGYAPFVIADQDKEYTFDAALDANGAIFYKLNDVESAILTINSANAVIEAFDGCGIEEIEDNDPGVLTVKVYTWTEDGSCVIGISSLDPSDAAFTVNVSEPEGFDENPVVLNGLDSITAEIAGGLNDSFYYIWNATSAGKVTLSITGAEWYGDALYMAATEWQDNYDEAGDWISSDPIAWDDVNPQLTIYVNGTEVVAGTEVVFDVKADDVVVIKVRSLPIYDFESYGYSAYIDVAGAFDALGSMNNPIVVNDPSELGGISVPAGEKVYIAISSMLNGQVLTIVGDANTAVYNRTTSVEAANNLFVVELNGVPSNMIVVENKGETDASYIAEIAYPAGSESNPIVLDAMAGVVNASADAGSSTYYLVNGSYNGNYILVSGSGLTVTVNGKAVEAVDGKYYVQLDGAPVNAIVITNAGTVAAEYAISITSGNPDTGDTGILVAAAAAIITLTGAVAMVAKKKEN